MPTNQGPWNAYNSSFTGHRVGSEPVLGLEVLSTITTLRGGGQGVIMGS